MDIRKSLNEMGLDAENAVVIGSGILDALGVRNSADIDAVVREDTYARLADGGRFTATQSYGHAILTGGVFEIGTAWGVLGKDQRFDDLYQNSTVVGGVRYITAEFLLAVKKQWAADGKARDKDIADIRLIETYLAQKAPGAARAVE